MGNSFKESITRICEIYTQDEAAALLGVASKSIQNYLAGQNPSKKTIGKIQELYKKLKGNNWERLPIQQLNGQHHSLQITPEAALLRVLVKEFAEYKAEKEGLDPDKIIKDIESKARIILEVVNRY